MTQPQAVELAPQLFESGWNIEEIRAYFERHGVKRSWPTVKRWARADFAERERERKRRQRSKYRVTTPTPDLMLALRLEDGLTYTAIARVAKRFLGEDLSPGQVRYRLYELGVEKNPRKVRQMTDLNRQAAG